MTGLDLDGDAEGAFADRAVPDVMISLSVPDKFAPFLPENFPDTLFIFGHYDTALSRRSNAEKTSVAPFRSHSAPAAPARHNGPVPAVHRTIPLKCKARDVLAGRQSDRRFRVPCQIYVIFHFESSSMISRPVSTEGQFFTVQN